MNQPVAASSVPLRDLVAMLRPHQWVKNLPVLAPLFLSSHDGDVSSWIATVVAFIAFSLVASGGYCINDVLDLKHDRSAPGRRRNPVASGHVPAPVATLAGGVLICGGLVSVLSVNPATAAAIAIYALGSLAYSGWLKRLFIIDCLILSGLFTLRLAAGAAAVDVPMSAWLTSFAVPLFLSLALMKRCAQIDGAETDMRLAGRNYQSKDRPLVHRLALATGLLAVLVLVGYVVLGGYEAGAYRAPMWLWGFPAAIALFLLRVATVLGKGRLDTDPVAFALRDPLSLGAGIALALSFFFARG